MATPKKDDSDALTAAAGQILTEREARIRAEARAEALAEVLAGRAQGAPEGVQGSYEREVQVMAERRAAIVRDGEARAARVRHLLIKCVPPFPGGYFMICAAAPTSKGGYRLLSPTRERNSLAGEESIMAPLRESNRRDLEEAARGLLRTPSGDMITVASIEARLRADARSPKYAQRKQAYGVFSLTLTEARERGLIQILREMDRDADLPPDLEELAHDPTIPIDVASFEAAQAARAGAHEVAP